MQPADYSFGKEKHLKSRKQIDQLFAGGKAFFVHPIKVFWQLERQAANEIQTTDDGRQTADEVQPTDEIQNTDKRQTTEQMNAIGKSIPLSLVYHPSSVVRRLSSVSVGVSASKRNFKKAVDRNRVKRLLREAYRLNQQDLVANMQNRTDTLQVFFIFVDKTIPTFALVQEKMILCLKRLQKIVGENKNEKLL